MHRRSTVLARIAVACLAGFCARCGGGGGSTAESVSPKVTGIAPALASPAVSTQLTLTGQGLLDASAAELVEITTQSTVALGGLHVVGDARLDAILAAGAPAGRYAARVTTPTGTTPLSTATILLQTAPSVLSLSPSSGFDDRATPVTLTGSGFTGTTSVVLDDTGHTALSGWTVLDDQHLSASVPAGVAGGVWDVRVTAAGGTNAAGEAAFEARNLVDPDQPGAFPVGFTDGSMTGATGDSVAVRVYYPALASGSGATPDSTLAPYPAVVFNHGYKPPAVAGGIDHRSYSWLTGALASFGYVVISADMVPNNNLLANLYVNAKADADDARAALNYLAARNASGGDPLQGLIDTTRAAVGGHSRGGDASLIAAADEVTQNGASARFLAVFGLGAPSFDPLNGGARIPFGNFTSVPCLEIGASLDTIAPWTDQADIFSQAGSPAMAFEVLGGNHSQYTDSGQYIPLDGIPTISLAQQTSICRRYVLAWLGDFVKGQSAFFAPYVLNGSVPLSDVRITNLSAK